MDIHAIGEMAGRIWRELSKSGATPVGDLSRTLGAEPQLVNMALGWLCREDKLIFERRGKSLLVRLRDAAVPADPR